MIFQKNEITTVRIDDIGAEGEGIGKATGKASGFTLFVKDAVPGDVVEARILKVKKNYAYAKTEKVVTPSPFRVEPKCKYHRQCGGCQLQALSYERQLKFKQDKIRGNLLRIGGFSEAAVDAAMEPIIGMEEPWHYRNKAQYPVGRDKEGHIVTGFYAGRTHSIIANTDCALGAAENRQILEMILEYMKENGVSPYDESTGTGLVRHVLIRKGFTSGEIMVCLVINRDAAGIADALCEPTGRHPDRLMRQGGSKKDGNNKEILPGQQDLIQKLTSVKGMASISLNFNRERSNVIMGKDMCTIWGKDTISDTIHVRDMNRPDYPLTGQELHFSISPLSFYQVNPVQTEKLYSLALQYAELTGTETVWDLYCGIGTISLFLASGARKVYGVEIVPEAIRDARKNAERNGIGNAEFFVGKAEEVLPEFYEHHGNGGDKISDKIEAEAADSGTAAEAAAMLSPDVIVVDPPRKGCDEACLATMLKMQPKRIVYVSCDSATLARDLKVLCEGGYELKKVRGVDQFGMTVHVETVCLLSNRKADSHIKLSLDMDEYYDIMDKEKAEKK